MSLSFGDFSALPERRTRKQWLERLSGRLTAAHSHLMYEGEVKDTIATLISELARHEVKGSELSLVPKLERFLLTRSVDFLNGPAKEYLNEAWEILRNFQEYSYTDTYASEIAQLLLQTNQTQSQSSLTYGGAVVHHEA